MLRACSHVLALLLLFVHAAALLEKNDDEDARNGGDVMEMTEEMLKSHGTAIRLSKRLIRNNLDVNSEDFTYFQSFRVKPNAVAVAKPKGQDYCFVVFRGTLFYSIRDWLSNIFPIGDELICHSGGDNNSSQCCRVRKAFTNSYKAPFRSQMEASIRECANTCANKDECVLFTGFSQGGALATTAAIYLADLNPRVVTIGAPLTVYPNCELANSTRWFRYIHTRVATTLLGQPLRLVYDPLPTIPGNSPIVFLPGRRAEHRGHLMIVSPENPMGIAYIGLDSQHEFRPIDPIVLAHFMRFEVTFANIVKDYDAIYDAKSNYNISISGFQDGSLCSIDAECMSKDCSKTRLFAPKRCQTN